MYNLETFQQKIHFLFGNHVKIKSFNGVKKPVTFYCEKCGNETTLQNADSLLRKGRKTACLKCEGAVGQKSKTSECGFKISHVLQSASSLEVVKDFSQISKDMTFRCKKCGNEFSRKPQVFLKSQKCPYCESRSSTKPLNVFVEDLKKAYCDEYAIVDFSEYKDAYTKIKVRHSCGFIYATTPHNTLTGKGCPKCSKKVSKGEKATMSFLLEHNIAFDFQKRIEYNGKTMIADFYLPNEKIIIEYHGIQHYKPVEFFGGAEAFENQKRRDTSKADYCRRNNIKLIEIPNLKRNEILTFLKSELNGSSTTSS